MGKLSAIFVHTWIGRRQQRAVRGGYVFQVGNFSGGFVPSWMRQMEYGKRLHSIRVLRVGATGSATGLDGEAGRRSLFLSRNQSRTSQQQLTHFPGRELFRRFCPYLDEVGATEGRQRRVRFPSGELFGELCPHLDCQAAVNLLERASWKTAGNQIGNPFLLQIGQLGISPPLQ